MIFGLDLASSECRVSGFVVLSLDGELICYGHLLSNNEILKWINFFKPLIISIDAPLSISKSGFRDCEKKLIKFGFRVYPITIKWMRKLAFRGSLIASKLRDSGYVVLETHPTSSLRACGFKGNYKSKEEVSEFILSRWGFKVPNDASKHVIDAYISALAGLSYLRGKALIFKGVDCSIVLVGDV